MPPCRPDGLGPLESHEIGVIHGKPSTLPGVMDRIMKKPFKELPRGFGLATNTCVVVASMVGVGILTTSGYILMDTGSATLMLALWLIGGLLALCGALTVAELAAAMPEAGGEYVYMRESFGRAGAFLYGWVSFLIGFSAPTAIVAHGAVRYTLEPWLGSGDTSDVFLTRILAAALLVAFTALHLAGQSASAKTQNVTTLLKILVLVFLALAGLGFGRGDVQHLAVDLPETGIPWSAMGVGLVYVMFSYSGWNAATYLAGETRDPQRMLPRALLLGCGMVVALYLLLNLAYAYAIPVGEIETMAETEVEAVAALAAQRLFGPWIAAPLSVGIGLGLLASLSAFLLTGPRVYYAMARDGLFPAAAARIHPRTQAPVAAILAQAACALALLFTGTFRDILTYTGVGLSLSAMFVVGSVFVLRIRRPAMVRPFKTPLYPLTPLLFLICTAGMIVFAFIQQPEWSTASIISILAGIPFYYAWRKRRR